MFVVNSKDSSPSNHKSLCRTCLKLVYKRFLNKLTEQSYLNRTVAEIIAMFLPDQVIAFDKNDLICPECLVVLSAFAKFIRKFQETEETHNLNGNKQLNNPPTTDKEKIDELKPAPHSSLAETANEQEGQVKLNQECFEISQPTQLDVINTTQAYSVKFDGTLENKKKHALETVPLDTKKEHDTTQVKDHDYCKIQDQEKPQEIQNISDKVDERTLTNESNTAEMSVEIKCQSCGSYIIEKGNNTKCSKCFFEEETQTPDNFLDASDNDSISSNTQELGDPAVSSIEKIIELEGVNTFETLSLDIKRIVGKGVHNHIVRVPGVKEIDPEFIKVLLKNNVKVLNQTRYEMNNKRILFVGESLLRRKCAICKKTFESYNLWLDHAMKSHEGLSWHLPPDVTNCKWKCFVQSLPLSTTSEKTYDCPACPRKFVSRKIMQKHVSKDHKDYHKFQCEHCSKSFKSKRHFKNHCWKFEQKQTCAVRKCVWCKEWVQKSDFHEHNDQHKNFICEKCGRSFLRQNHLNVHLKNHSGVKRKKRANRLCPFCGKTVWGIASHIRTVHGKKEETKLMCHLCSKVLKSKVSLKNHVATVHGEKKRIQCSLCKKRCSTLQALRCHNRLKHSNAPKHTCVICGESFVRGDYYRRHMDSHINGHKRVEGQRKPVNSYKKMGGPVKCKICSKTLSSIHNLKIHLTVHLAYRDRFKCKYCDVTFNLEGNKRRHERLHENFKIRCNICWKKFTNDAELEEHLVIHENKKKYNCHICAQCFSRKYLLAHHVMVDHKDDIVVEEKLKEQEIVFKEGLEEYLG